MGEICDVYLELSFSNIYFLIIFAWEGGYSNSSVALKGSKVAI